MGKHRKQSAKEQKNQPLETLITWAQSLILGSNSSAGTETARELGVGEEAQREKRARNRTKEENERDLAP
jgi:hypothetical protein